jgi:hypothetical protein
MEFIIRFLVGGVVVSFFAMIGGALKPKSFAGVFSAAPSVALATITLTVLKKGTQYAAIEAQSMLLGAAAFLIYACLVSRVLFRGTFPVVPTTTIALLGWIGLALGLRFLI